LIYPTRRAIYLLLAGAPMALVLGLVRPELWLVAPGWIGMILACLIVDCVAGANPRHLNLDARFPHQVGVGDPFDLSLAATGAAVPPRAELALALDERLAEGGRLAGDMRKVADADILMRTLSLTASRRGQARIEALWIRWAGPLGLVWKQRKFAIDGAINIVPSLRAVTDEGSRLFQRNSWFGLRQQRLRGEGSEFEALAEYQPGWIAARSTGMPRRATSNCSPRNIASSATIASCWQSTADGQWPSPSAACRASTARCRRRFCSPMSGSN
jgi:uncharacterized protein (DUF58 family)